MNHFYILNTTKNKVYVGAALDTKKHLARHIRQLDRGCHGNVEMQNDWTHAKDSWQYDVVGPHTELIVCNLYNPQRILAPSTKALSRFWNSIHKKKDGCWEWVGPQDHNGYGLFTHTYDGRQIRIMAHRMAIFLAGKDVGQTIRRSCGNRLCVNPDHLL